jgi:hypothetical protein
MLFQAEYGQTARRTAEYRLVGAGGRRDGEVQATGQRIGEGWCRRRQSNDGRERGICGQIVGFARSLANRAGPFPLFSRPESPRAPRGTGVGLGSPDGFRAKSGGKRGTGGATGPNTAMRPLAALFFHPDSKKWFSHAPGSSFSSGLGLSSIRRAHIIPGPTGRARGVRRKQKRGKR